MPSTPLPRDGAPILDDGVSRAPSLWPDTLRPPAASSFEASRFGLPAADATPAPDLCHPALALRAVLGVQAVLAIGGLFVAAGVADWALRTAVHGFAGLVGTLLWLTAACAAQRRLRGGLPLRRALVLSALGAAAALLGWLPLVGLGVAGPAGALRALGVAAAGAALAALAWAWLEGRARQWQPVDARVRLAELQSRIRPHFLFNALNTALALVRVDPARAEAVLEDLAELFRTALADTGSSVSLDEEVALARRYLAIEQIRFGRRLRVHWNLDARALHARVPPLLLQPLVENAVRHGVEPSADGAEVWISAVVRRGQVLVEVENTVPDEPSEPGLGMALRNVRERLRLLHDVGAHFEARQEGARFVARVGLPL